MSSELDHILQQLVPSATHIDLAKTSPVLVDKDGHVIHSPATEREIADLREQVAQLMMLVPHCNTCGIVFGNGQKNCHLCAADPTYVTAGQRLYEAWRTSPIIGFDSTEWQRLSAAERHEWETLAGQV